MPAPALSVVVPVYNGEKYLAETLDSLFAQTFTDFELLLIDDGSTDATPEIAAACADPRLRYLRNEGNRGISYSANRGIEESRGKYMVRSDADDICMPYRLQAQWEFMEAHPEIAVSGGWLQYMGARSGELRLPLDPQGITCHLPFVCSISQGTSIFRREFLLQRGLRYDTGCIAAGDYDLWYRITHDHGGLIANQPLVMIRYRIHAASISMASSSLSQQTASRTRARYFTAWGLMPSPEEIAVHDHLYRNSTPPTREGFAKAHAWLLRLHRQNRKKPLYAAEIWDRLLAAKVFGLAASSLHLGPWVCSRAMAFPGFGLLQVPQNLVRDMLREAERCATAGRAAP